MSMHIARSTSLIGTNNKQYRVCGDQKWAWPQLFRNGARGSFPLNLKSWIKPCLCVCSSSSNPNKKFCERNVCRSRDVLFVWEQLLRCVWLCTILSSCREQYFSQTVKKYGYMCFSQYYDVYWQHLTFISIIVSCRDITAVIMIFIHITFLSIMEKWRVRPDILPPSDGCSRDYLHVVLLTAYGTKIL